MVASVDISQYVGIKEEPGPDQILDTEAFISISESKVVIEKGNIGPDTHIDTYFQTILRKECGHPNSTEPKYENFFTYQPINEMVCIHNEPFIGQFQQPKQPILVRNVIISRPQLTDNMT